MGTNYYHIENVCEHCGRGDEGEHIGKSSAGWTFSFQGTPEIRSYADWLARLEAGGIIRNEYGDVVTLDEFKELVEAERGAKLNHTHYSDEHHPGVDVWLDDDGHSFSGGEVS